MKPYEEIAHTADWALRVWGATPADLFANAAAGMYELMGAQIEAEAPAQTRELALDAPDLESLLVAWLNELLYLTESESLAFNRFEIKLLEAAQLEAHAAGGHVVELKKQIKAVTFHNLRIVNTDGQFETTIVFDV